MGQVQAIGGRRPSLLSVYCEGGRYVSDFAIKSGSAASVGFSPSPSHFQRRDAIAACDAARRAGVRAWLIPAVAVAA